MADPGPEAEPVVAEPVVAEPAAAGSVAALRAALRDREERLTSMTTLIETEQARLDSELALARRIQLNLMPDVPPEFGGWEIATAYRAARQVGGDFYDVYELPQRPGRVGVAVADVTGKGVTAALMMAFTRAVLRAAAFNGSGPSDALRRTNSVLVRDARTGLFVTVFIAELDAASGEVRYANGGHEPPLLMRASARTIAELPAGGELLGAFAGLTVEDDAVTLEPGDVLVAYTDGVIDARDAHGRRFGVTRLRAVLRAHRGVGPEELLDAVVDEVRTFVRDEPPADDVTLVAIRRPRGA